MWNKLIVALSIVISIIFHHLFFECLYWRWEKNSSKRDDALKATKLLEVEKPKRKEKPFTSDKKKKIRVKKEAKRKTRKNASPKPEPRPNLASKAQNREKRSKETELVSLGRKILNGSARGSFPPLSLDYKDPKEFLKEIYELGGKTYLYDRLMKSLVGEVNLLNWNSFIKERKDFPPHFSPFRRVIEDDWVKRFKEKMVVSLYGGWESDYEVLLLIPEELEAKWIGHQLKLFENCCLNTEDVAKVLANFGNRKMAVRQIVLKNGKQVDVEDKGV